MARKMGAGGVRAIEASGSEDGPDEAGAARIGAGGAADAANGVDGPGGCIVPIVDGTEIGVLDDVVDEV